MRVCIDFIYLHRDTPKYEYHMSIHIVNMFINDAYGYIIISFLDGNADHNQILMVEEDKFLLVCLSGWLCFWSKNIGLTYQML